MFDNFDLYESYEECYVKRHHIIDSYGYYCSHEEELLYEEEEEEDQ